MKLTWFGGSTIRVHIGGRILVADAQGAPEGIDRVELVSGADVLFALSDDDAGLAVIDPANWRPRRAGRVIDQEGQDESVHVHRIGRGAVLVDALGEAPVVLLTGHTPPQFGRWADASVVVLFGDRRAITKIGMALLDLARPKLVALAADEADVDAAIGALAGHLSGAGLVSLEPALALEV